LQCRKLLFQFRQARDHNPIGRAVGFQKPLLPAMRNERRPIQLQPADVKHAGLGEAVQGVVVGERYVSAEIVSLWMLQALERAGLPVVSLELIAGVTAVNQVHWLIGAALGARLNDPRSARRQPRSREPRSSHNENHIAPEAPAAPRGS
jgi:hypothetical protein